MPDQPQTQQEELDLDELFNPTPNLSPREQALQSRLSELENALSGINQQSAYTQQAQIANQIRALPPEQQQVAIFLYQMAAALDSTRRENETLKVYSKRMEEAVMPLVKDKVVTEISTKSGIEKALIEKYGADPKTAKAVAGAIYEYKKTVGFEQRKEVGSDKVPSEAQSIPSDKETSEIKKKFYGSGNIAGYLKALREANS